MIWKVFKIPDSLKSSVFLRKDENIPDKNPSKWRGRGLFEIDNFRISEFVLKKLIPICGYSPYPLNELMLMAGAVCYSRPNYIFDWGTHIGKSARIFYETCRFYKIKTEIHTIDLPENIDHPEHPHMLRGLLIRKIKKIRMHLGDGLNVSLNIASKIKRKEARLLFFLDGDHEYKSVNRELQGIRTLKHKVFILAHDTFWQINQKKLNTGPYKAVRSFLLKNKQFTSATTQTGFPGMTFIYKEQDRTKF